MDFPTILAVDDEPLNREIIIEYLTGRGQHYHVDTAADGIEAMEKLVADPAKYDVVLLDRMMPRMSGMEVLAKISEHPELKYIPVILQTAKVSNEDVLEGMKAGAYYYLTKPFKSEMLLSVVKTAVKDRLYNKKLLSSLNTTRSSVKLMQNARFQFQSMEDVNALSALVACTSKEPDKVALGLMELMLNAVEHGNLGIGYQDKSALRKQGAWEDEINHRLSLPENRDKYASIEIFNDDDGVTFIITDEGEGFDWRNFLVFDAERVMDNHGRGIAMANQLYFTEVEYLDKGNKVKAYVQKQ